MENTVIGVYDSYTQADNALNELLASGFSRNEARLTSGASEEGQPPGMQSQQPHESGIGHFFRSLFGMDDHPDHHDIYTEALQRGSCVLSVNAADDERRDRAIEIMNRYDPVDLDERAAHWRSQGWSGRGQTAAPSAPAASDAGRNRYVPGTAGGSGASGTSGSAGTPDAAATSAGAATEIPLTAGEPQAGTRDLQRSGVRVYQRVSQGPVTEVIDNDISPRDAAVEVQPASAARANRDIDDTAATAEDADFRDHWRNVYGQSGQRYEDYDAAYRYGAGLGNSERFRNYRWSDVEGDVRNDWETRHPESEWERVKEAVRYGAERGTPGQQH